MTLFQTMIGMCIYGFGIFSLIRFVKGSAESLATFCTLEWLIFLFIDHLWGDCKNYGTFDFLTCTVNTNDFDSTH